MIGIIGLHQFPNGIENTGKAICHWQVWIDIDDPMTNMAQARSDKIDHAPTRMPQTGINPENPNRFTHTICISAYG